MSAATGARPERRGPLHRERGDHGFDVLGVLERRPAERVGDPLGEEQRVPDVRARVMPSSAPRGLAAVDEVARAVGAPRRAPAGA